MKPTRFSRIKARLNPLRLLIDDDGTAAIEFAFILPVMLLMTLPVYDYTQLILTREKVDKTAMSIADMIVISKPADGSSNATTTTVPADLATNPYILTEDALKVMLPTAKKLMIPYPFDASTVSSVQVVAVFRPAAIGGVATAPETRWSATYDGASPPNITADFPNQTPVNLSFSHSASVDDLIANMGDNEAAVIVHVAHQFTPALENYAGISIPGLGQQMIEATSVYPCRYGPLLFVYQP